MMKKLKFGKVQYKEAAVVNWTHPKIMPLIIPRLGVFL